MTEQEKPKGKLNDWETIFECSENGFIPLVENARSLGALRECAHLIINKLFTRKNDGPIRTAYETALDEILPGDAAANGRGAAELEDKKRKVTSLLRSVKDQRKQKVEELRAQRAREEAEAETERRHPEPAEEPVAEKILDAVESMEGLDEENEYEELDDFEEIDLDSEAMEETAAVEEIFADVCCDFIRKRFNIIRADSNHEALDGLKLPFLMSEEFAGRFKDFMRKYLIPEMLNHCRGVTTRASNQPEDQQLEYMRETFDNKDSRGLLWEAWQEAWHYVMSDDKQPPPKPEEKSKGLMGIFKRKKETDYWDDDEELTLEEWKEVAKDVKASNKQARKVWIMLLENTGGYLPPFAEDSELLMNIFGRSAAGMQKHIDALRQMAQQGSVGKAFDAYQRGKNLDLILLAVSYQHPGLFLSTKKPALKEMLGGFSDKHKKDTFPLLMRYLFPYA